MLHSHDRSLRYFHGNQTKSSFDSVPSRGFSWLWHGLTTLVAYDFELAFADRSSLSGARESAFRSLPVDFRDHGLFLSTPSSGGAGEILWIPLRKETSQRAYFGEMEHVHPLYHDC